MKNACDAKLLRRSFRFPGLEILATVVVKFTASPHSVFVGSAETVRLQDFRQQPRSTDRRLLLPRSPRMSSRTGNDVVDV